MKNEIILEVENLTVDFKVYNGNISAVRGVSFNVHKGETLGIVGESGCGKSVTSKAITRLLTTPPAIIKANRLLFNKTPIQNYTEKEMQKVRGKNISMIFQDPMTSLNPTKRVGIQIMEPLLKHENISKEQAKEKAINMLKLVGIPNPEERFKQYPHQFSGGMRQRAMIALAMITNPQLLIADEPTTALDVTIQAQILDLMKEIQEMHETAIIMITHNLGVIANIAQRIAVMYAGKIVEIGTTEEIFYNPKHPYTWGLLDSIPSKKLKRKQDLIPIAGTPPDLFAPPVGCGFSTRCDYCMKICKEKQPPVYKLSETQEVACWLLDEKAPKVERKKVHKDE